MLYFGRRYTVQAAGAAMRGAYCENCGCEYLYRIERAASGQGSSPYMLDNDGAQRRAAASAQKTLIKLLKEVDPVHCPDCGWLQQNMVARLRRKYNWLIWFVVIGAIAALIGYAFGLEPCLYLSAATVLFFSLWWILRSNFDPNLVAARRVEKEGGSRRAMLRSDVEPKLAELAPDVQVVLAKGIVEIETARATQPAGGRRLIDPSAQQIAEAERQRRLRRGLFVWGLSGVAAFVVIGPLCGWQNEHAAYEKFVEQNRSLPAVEQYLRAYPNGRYATEAAGHRDDLLFDLALNTARSANNVTALRGYLKDAALTRHRDEAQQAVRESFENAIKHVEQLPKSKQFDTDLRDGIAALLKARMDSGKPEVALAVRGSVEAAPTTKDMKDLETNSCAKMKAEDPGLKKLIAESPSSDWIISSSGAFDDLPQQRRELAILNRVQFIVDQAAGAHVLEFSLAPPKGATAAPAATPAAVPTAAEPDVVIDYRIYPSGDVTGFTKELPSNYDVFAARNNLPPDAQKPREAFVGFARIYAVDWSLTIHAPNFAQKAPVTWSSNADGAFDYRWVGQNQTAGVYAAMLHRAVFASAQELARKLGLAPPDLPNTFTADGPIGRW